MRGPSLAAAVATALWSGCVADVRAADTAPAAEPGAPVTGRFPSPDGRLVAVIAAGQEKRPGGAEMLITTAAGQPLLRGDYASGEKAERLDILQARWTPDSAFFVFSATSADGHQSWRFPVLFYSRAPNVVRRLEDSSGGLSVVAPAFKVMSPDIVEVVGQKTIDRPRETRRFRLSGLVSGSEKGRPARRTPP
jgi:hypothetical protein